MKFRNGDLFRWSYKQSVIDDRQDSVNAGTLYWCCARIVVYKDGNFNDIYWSYGRDGMSWSEEKAEKEINLMFLANKDEIEKTTNPKWYDDCDLVDLNHPNAFGNNMYVKKGAKKSKEKMKKVLLQKIQDANSAIDSAKYDLKRYSNTLKELDDADNAEDFYI